MTGEELAATLEPTVQRLGYELVDLELRLAGNDGLVRIYIDSANGIGLDDCEKVSRAVSALLDVEDPFPGNYNLEVSSPGLDRKLTKSKHFQRFIGHMVKVKLRMPLDGRRRFRGKLLSQDDENIVVEVDGQSYSLPLTMIDTARLVPDEA
jgi:ribosome maturation factor RimP